jgi:hypothetical protein
MFMSNRRADSAQATKATQMSDQFPAISPAMRGADEQSTSKFRVLVKANDDKDEVTIRIDRARGTGRPLYETLVLNGEEANALLIALMNEIG